MSDIADYEAAKRLLLRYPRLPTPISNMLIFEQNLITSSTDFSRHVNVSSMELEKYRSLNLTQQFMESYYGLPFAEKIAEYVRAVNILVEVYRKRPVMHVSQSTSTKRFDVYIKDGIIRRWWHKCMIELNFVSCNATVIGTNDSSIDLHYYLVRKSNNQKKIAFVLESTKPHIPRMVKIGFDTQPGYQSCYEAFLQAINKATWENFCKEVGVRDTDKSQRVFLPNQSMRKKSEVLLEASSAGSTPLYRPPYGQHPSNILADVKESIVWPVKPSTSLPLTKSQNHHNTPHSRSSIQTQPFFSTVSNIQTVSSPTAHKSLHIGYTASQSIEDRCFEIMSSFMRNVSLDEPSERSFVVVENSITYKIQKHIQRPNCFRLVLNISKPKSVVVPGIIEPANYPIWNSEVVKGDTKLRVFKHNYTVCKQMHRHWMQSQLPTEFLYLRHLCCKNNTIYIIDRSIDLEEFPPAQSTKRGHISSCIWTVQDAMGTRMTRLTLQVEMVLKPPLHEGEQTELAIRYLRGMAKLDYYMLKNQCFSNNSNDYFDLNWPIGQLEAPAGVTVTNNQSMKIRRQELVDEQPDELQLFDQELSLIDDNDSYRSMPGLNQSLRESYPQQRNRNEGLNITPIANLDQSFGETVSPYFPGAQQKTIQPAPIRRKGTDEFGNELQNQVLNMQRQSKQNPNALMTQLTLLLTDSKPSQQDERILNRVSLPSNSNGTIPATKKQLSQVVPSLNWKSVTVTNDEYLRSRTPLHPIQYAYRPMRGKQKNRTDWKNFAEGYDLRVNENGEVVCINQEILRSNQQAIAQLSRGGETMASISSLPVQIFGETSVLQRVARTFCFVPYYLEKASTEQQADKRFAAVVALSFATAPLLLDPLMPLPSVLGETYQGWIYGSPVYCEHIQTQPDKIYAVLQGRGYRVQAIFTPIFAAKDKCILFAIVAAFTVVFDNNTMHRIMFEIARYDHLIGPDGRPSYKFISGSNEQSKSDSIFSLEDNIGCRLNYPADGTRRVQGTAESIGQGIVNSLFKTHIFEGIQRGNFEGIWPYSLSNQESVLFDIQRDRPCQLSNQMYPIPSDSTYRSDIHYTKLRDFSRAQAERQKIDKLAKEDDASRKKAQAYSSQYRAHNF